MAFTTPATSTAATVLTAGFLNTYVRDDIAWIATDSPTCRTYHSTVGALPVSTLSPLAQDSERFDNAAMHSTSVNNTRITIPTGGAGKYIIGATVTWQLNATGYRQVRFQQNASAYLAIDTRVDTSGATGVESAPMTVYALAAADYVECVAQQSAGAGLQVGGNPGPGPEFYVFWYRT